MSRPLGIVAGVLAVGVLTFYGWRFFSRPRTPSPEDLARAALTAATPGERERAAVALSQLGRPAREQMVRLVGQSPQPEVRAACIRGLAENWCYRSMPVLLGALDDEAVVVRAQAGDAVGRMLRVDYDFRADDPEQPRRQEIAQRLRACWEEFQRSTRGKAFIRQQQGEDL